MISADFPKEVQEDLRKSGLSDAVLSENGVCMVPPDQIQKIEPNHASKVRFALEFPYHHLNGSGPFSRVRLYPPVPTKEGRPKKYSQPAGSENHLYIPRSIPAEQLQDASALIVICEGEKKSLAALQTGLGVVAGVSGVWSWQKAGVPIADMDLIAWSGRRCLVCFDSDIWRAGKDNLRKAVYAFGKELEARGAQIEFVVFPDGPDGEKVGLDDFLLTRPAEAFFSLPRTNTADAKHFRGMRSWWSVWKKDYVSKGGADFHELVARHVLDSNAATPIIYVQDDGFYKYQTEGFYRPLSEELLSVEIRSGIRTYQKAAGLDGKTIEAKRTMRAEIRDAMRDILLKEQPQIELNKTKDILNVQNGLLGLTTMKLAPHTPEAHLTLQFCAKYDEAAECPLWLKALEDIFALDEKNVRAEKIEMLRRFFGLCLVPDQSFQKILVLIGEGQNGKGLVTSVLRGILGLGNYSSVSIDQLSNNFYVCELQNKLVNIASEISKNPVSDSIIKRLSGEDSIAADRKNQPPIKFFSFARLIFLMNDIPLIEDRTHAFYRRLLVIKFTRTFTEEERQRNLSDVILANERDGIFRWMIGGLLSLKKDDRFPESDSTRNAVLEFRRENNSVLAFAEEWLETSELGQLKKGLVYEAYNMWCEQNGKKPFAANKFSSLLQKALPGIRDAKTAGGTVRVWDGLSFSGEADPAIVKRTIFGDG